MAKTLLVIPSNLLLGAIALSASLFRSGQAGLVFRSPPELAGLESELCVPWVSTGNQSKGKFELKFGRVDTDFCGISCSGDDRCPEQGLVRGSRGKFFNVSRYSSITPLFPDIKRACSSYAPAATADRLQWAYDLSVANGCATMIDLYQLSNERKKIPGGVTYVMAGISKEIPIFECSWLGELPTGYANDVILSDRMHFNATATLEVDKNPWLPYFDSVFYQLYFRGWGVFYVLFATFTAKCLRERMKKPSKDYVPELLLFVETIRCSILGLHFVFGSLFADGSYPTALHLGLISQLGGMSMSSSLLSGIFFAEIAGASTSGKKANFWRKNKRKVWGLTAMCFALDIVSFVCGAFNVRMAELLISLLMTIFQGVIAISFIRNSVKFVGSIMGVVGNAGTTVKSDLAKSQSNNTQHVVNRVRLVATWLFISACGMLAFTMMAPIVALSGSRIGGLWTPFGWTCFWVFGNVVCFTPSFAQVQMSRERKKKRKRKSMKSTKVATSSVASSGATSSHTSSQVNSRKTSFIAAESSKETSESSKESTSNTSESAHNSEKWTVSSSTGVTSS